MYYSRRELPPRESISSKILSIIGIPRLFHSAEVDDFVGKESIKETAQRYVDNIHDMFDDCVNLSLIGSNGNGKTFLTSIILKNAYRYHYSAKRITYSTYIGLCFGKKTDEDYLAIEHIHNVEFLAIDEIGKEVGLNSGANISLLEELLKFRDEKGLPTLICTNSNLEDLRAFYGNTIYSMITQSVIIGMKGEDVREELFCKRKGVEILLGGKEE